MATDIAGVLAHKRTQLQDQLAELTRPVGERGDISFGKRVGDGTSQAVDRLSAVSAHDKLQVLLAEVERAEAKIEEATYGTCDVCGEPIGAERLEVRAWATRCVKDA
ncbi:MAG TPA: TraR/DksA family transcriptional regulator [Nocardioidaceae bacterium]|nr:TraR/DksA family transcriptional regulator [Nocardioidaceae bacterium]